MEEKEKVSKNFIEMAIDKDLEEGVYDHVMTRFPPEPNGYLHIGHAKSILLNYGLAQKYNGKFNLRFDDTNPTKEKVEFVESIKKDVEWLGADYEDRLFFASDYFDQMYEAAVTLIKKGKAYVCDLSAEEIREYRGTLKEPGQESPYRYRSVVEILELFEKNHQLLEWRDKVSLLSRQLVMGFSGSSKAVAMASALSNQVPKIFIVTSTQNEAEQLVGDLSAILGEDKVYSFFADDVSAAEFIFASPE